MQEIGNLPYRKCVSVILFKDKSHFLLVKKNRKNHAWQLPQGGAEEGESSEEALKREIKEELGIDLENIYKLSCTYSYPWPKEHQEKRGFTGQEVCFFAAKLPTTDFKFNTADIYEPQEAKLLTLEEALDLIDDNDYKKTLKKIYKEGLNTLYK